MPEPRSFCDRDLDERQFSRAVRPARAMHYRISMIVRRYQDLDTWQLTEEFKHLVHALVKGSDQASRNFRHRDQIFNSSGGPSKHVLGGLRPFQRRRSSATFSTTPSAPLRKLKNHLRDGIDWGYYSAEACEPIFHMARRCAKAILGLKHSQKRYIAAQEERRRQEQGRETASTATSHEDMTSGVRSAAGRPR